MKSTWARLMGGLMNSRRGKEIIACEKGNRRKRFLNQRGKHLRIEALESRNLMAQIPVLNSLPGANASIYLDFDGHFESTWGSYSNVTTPKFDLEGNPNSLSTEEAAFIEDLWRIVAEDFSAFNINVTTVEPAALAPGAPASQANGVALRVAIGGLGIDVIGSNYSGLAHINSFTSNVSNLALVFPQSSAGGNYSLFFTSAVTSHEAGHSFGLRHRDSDYDLSAQWTGIMSSPTAGYEDAWWRNGLNEFGNPQDDMATIANSTNGFGYRPDDHGNSAATSTPLGLLGETAAASGVISTTSDVDYFSFSITSSDTYSFKVNDLALGANLDAVLEIRGAANQLVASAAPANSHRAEILTNLEPGNYTIVVKSTGVYGRVGQYSLSIDAGPAGLFVTPSSSFLTTGEDGRQATISISLKTQPSASVTIPLQSSDASLGSLSVQQLVFNASNWNVPQVVTITGLDDSIIGNDSPYSILFDPMISTDSDYSGADWVDLPIINVDNDVLGFLYSTDTVTDSVVRSNLSGGVRDQVISLPAFLGTSNVNYSPRSVAVDEVGGKVYWSSQPDNAIYRSALDGTGAQLIVPLAGTPALGLAIDSAAGKLYWGDYNGRKIMRSNLDGSQLETVVATAGNVRSIALDVAAGKMYWTDALLDRGIKRANLNGSGIELVYSNSPNDSPVALALDLDAGKMYWSDLGANVIRWANFDGSAAETLFGTNPLASNSQVYGLTIDRASQKLYWNDRASQKTFRSNLDGSLLTEIANSSTAYGLAIARPGHGIGVTGSAGLVTNEDRTTAEFRISLNTRPTSNVTFSLASNDLTEGTLSHTSVTFTPTNWSTPQVVTITGVNDSILDYDQTYNISFTQAVSTDPNYNGLQLNPISVTNRDNEIATTTFTKTDGRAIPDRGTLNSDLAVTTAGTLMDVNVRVNITHGWNTDLDVTLIAPDGTRIELFTDVGGSSSNFTNTVLDQSASTAITAGAAPFTGVFRPEGNLNLLNGKSLAGNWRLEVKDDERLLTGTLIDWALTATYSIPVIPAGVTVTPTSGLVTSENGTTQSFTVVLTSAPDANATISIASSDTTEGSVSTSSLMFTPTNWNVPQTVVVTGVNDAIVDGAIAYSIITGAIVSADSRYSGFAVPDVAVTNTDNDTPPPPTTVFEDSFDVGEWNGRWVEDSQNDWYRSNQRATQGSWSAEIDGAATNATLTTASSFNVTSYSTITLTYSWFIESSWDAGEYIALDVSINGGSTWTQNVRQLRGNVDPENSWRNETVDLTPYKSSQLRVRFRSSVSDADEDGNVDNVKIVGVNGGGGSGEAGSRSAFLHAEVVSPLRSALRSNAEASSNQIAMPAVNYSILPHSEGFVSDLSLAVKSKEFEPRIESADEVFSTGFLTQDIVDLEDVFLLNLSSPVKNRKLRPV